MKCVLIIALASSVVSATEKGAFRAWMREHGRKYATREEYEERFANFKKNAATVKAQNAVTANVEGGARYTLNKFADRSEAELKRRRGLIVPKNPRDGIKELRVSERAFPQTFDWRTTNIISPIQDQGDCGSCWAFSATCNIESQNALKKLKPVVKLSEQQLVDCDRMCGNYSRGNQNGCDDGCNGGLMPTAFLYVKANGQTTEDAYPYEASNDMCMAKSMKMVEWVNGFAMLPMNETQMAMWIAKGGPASIAVDASNWSFYSGGMMDPTTCGNTTYDDLDHGVNLVGYDLSANPPYWILRNSWNTDWGNNGYAHVPFGVNFCGLALFASVATL